MLVSAIIPTYNRADLLGRALESVMAQDYRPIEAVVVDDGSVDHTDQVIERYREKLAARGMAMVVQRQRNGRAPKARNVGMRLAHGELFAFLDSDDLWRPGFVSTLVRLMRGYPSAGLAFCGILVVDEEDRVWTRRNAGLWGMPVEGVLERPFHRILRHMPLQTSGVMVRRSVVEDVGDFSLDVPVVEDWDLWYRISKTYDFAYTLESLACNRCHPDNLPKYDCVALSSGLRMNLRHLPDVKDEATRQILLRRVQWQFTLLQEEVLRWGLCPSAYAELLRHELAPRTPRFELGAMLADGPQWAGRAYARAVRLLGEMRRGVAT